VPAKKVKIFLYYIGVVDRG